MLLQCGTEQLDGVEHLKEEDEGGRVKGRGVGAINKTACSVCGAGC